MQTVSSDLFWHGKIACRFLELNINKPRNRLLHSSLTVLRNVLDDKDLAHKTRTLSGALGRPGVNGAVPSQAEMATDQVGRHDAEARLMVSLAVLYSILSC